MAFGSRGCNFVWRRKGAEKRLEKGVKSEEKRRVFFWVVRWAYPALTNQAVYLDWIGDGEIVGVAVWW